LPQLLAAFETLKDAVKRREYDLEYPSVFRKRESTQGPPPAPDSDNISSEAAQIAKLRRTQKARHAAWAMKQRAHAASRSRLQQSIDKLEQAISKLADLIAAA